MECNFTECLCFSEEKEEEGDAEEEEAPEASDEDLPKKSAPYKLFAKKKRKEEVDLSEEDD